MDDLTRSLRRLAPTVDTDEALDAFRARAARRRGLGRRLSGRRPLFLAAAVVVVAVIGAGAIAGNDPDDTVVVGTGSTEAQPPSTGSLLPGKDFEVLSRHAPPGTETVGSLRSAVNQAELDRLFEAVGLGPDDPAIGGTVVVAITIPEDACPSELVRFHREGDTLTPVFQEPPGGCDEPLIPKTFVIALRNRAELSPVFTLRLPADPDYHDGAELVVWVDDTAPPVETTTTTTGPQSVTTAGGDAACAVPDPVPAAGEMLVDVYFFCGPGSRGSDLVPVPRVIPRTTTPLRAALEALLNGPTPAEVAVGLTSGVPEELRGVTVFVTIMEGTARIGIDGDVSGINNVSTSNGSFMLLTPIDATALQFNSVDAVVLDPSLCPSADYVCDEPTTREDLTRTLGG